jgi:hypothetical protein
MTQLSTPVVQDLVAKYIGAVASESSEQVKEAPKTVKESKTESNVVTEARGLTDSEKVEQALALVASLSGYDSYAKVEKHLNRLFDEIAITNAPAPEMREETEEEALAREARELSAGYR